MKRNTGKRTSTIAYQKAGVDQTDDRRYNKDNNSMIAVYIKSIRMMSNATSQQYLRRLYSFSAFIKNEFNSRLDVNDLVNKIKQGELDTYDILSKYSGYLQSSYNITALTLQACCNCEELS